MAGAAWGERFFKRVLEQLPATASPAERRLLRSAYRVHSLVSVMRDDPSDREAWGLIAAIETFKATAHDAQEAGIASLYVREIVAITTVAAGGIVDTALAIMGKDPARRTDAP